MRMTTIRKGRIGELEVTQDLLKKGWNVYSPVVDDHGIDLVAEKGNITHHIQVKTKRPSKGKTSIEVVIRIPSKADYLAVPLAMHKCVCYIPVDVSVESFKNKKSIALAFKKSKNGQVVDRNWYEDYLELPE